MVALIVLIFLEAGGMVVGEYDDDYYVTKLLSLQRGPKAIMPRLDS